MNGSSNSQVDVSVILQNLKETLEQKKLSPFESENICRDLSALIQRINTNAYTHSDYIARNTFDIPRRTEEFLVYLDGYAAQAKLWSEKLKPFVRPQDTIIDLCPGWGPKIELALKRLYFTGNVYLFDLDEKASEAVIKLMSLYGYDYNLSSKKINLFHKFESPQADIIVGNHIFDDLLLYLYAEKTQQNIQIFYGSEDELVLATQEILKNRFNYKEELIQTMLQVLEILSHQGTVVILTHYFGLLESSLNLSEWNSFCIEVLNELANECSKKLSFSVLEKNQAHGEIILRREK